MDVAGSQREAREQAMLLSAFVGSATVWLLIATAIGVLLSFKFPFPDLATSPYLSFGRLRAIHTNGTFYAFASVALSGMAIYVAARSSGAAVFAKPVAWASLGLFNLAAILGTITLDLGMSDGSQEYREWLWWVRVIFLAGAICSAYVVAGTIANRVERPIYIANWYTLGAFTFTTILWIVALIPSYQIGLGGVTLQAFYMHNAVGMWFTFLALGVTYYALPKLLNRPIYSYSLGVLAFWTNLVFYPIIGSHHYEFSPLPWWLQTLAIVFSVGMLIPVFAGSANLILTTRGRWEIVRRSYALPFLAAGVVYYFVGSTQGTFEALRTAQAYWHFTSFTVGHSHATMYGFITLITFGAVYALLPLATGQQPSLLLTGVHFWFALLGVTLYVVVLSVGGTIQGIDWASGNPFISSVEAAAPFWLARALGGSMMFVSHLLFAYNVYVMVAAKQTAFEPKAQAA
jgi:cytochrome c oxidase cbb3-type subunit 1